MGRKGEGVDFCCGVSEGIEGEKVQSAVGGES